MMRHLAGLSLLFVCLVSPLLAQQPDSKIAADAQLIDVAGARLLTGAAAAKAVDATIDFAGAGFGSGIALVIEAGQKRRVADAQLVNGIVRVTKDTSTTPRILLNLHYFFTAPCESTSRWCRTAQITENGQTKNVLIAMRGWGPFVAVQPGSDTTISAVGGGLLWGWRRQPDKSDSFNVGVGVLADQGVKTLGDGIRENQPLPTGETQIRFKESTRWGVLLTASWAF
jgi:hypothetical protein